MHSNKTFSSTVPNRETRSRTSPPALEAVRVSPGLIAFYPRAIHRRQPYVILLDQASGIIKRLDLEAGK
jgi:hypothetical protein